MSEAILLENAAGDAAAVTPFGAELAAWRARGVDLIWAKDDRIWDQTAPILFPVVGWTRDGAVRVKGRSYPLALHGFAWRKSFRVTERRADSLRLELAADHETRALYPFDFRLEASFALLPGGLETALVVENTGDEPLPYACGLHPAFRWPLAGSSAPHSIVFAEPENPDVPVIGPGGLLSKPTRRLPLKRDVLPLAPDMFASDALVFLNRRSRKLAFDNGAGARLVVETEDFPHIGFWTRPPASYLCIEPWTGHGDPDDFFGDLYEKPSMRLLAPGQSARHAATFRFEPAE
ncbi:MAG TPA: aldose 1-epimerase family protein [Methylocystis sp.]|nr:aldose 1-epimerase family protein [Methylocystis sp.]